MIMHSFTIWTNPVNFLIQRWERVTINSCIPPPSCMFIQLVGIPVPQDGSGVVTIGDVPVPPCWTFSRKSLPTRRDDYSLSFSSDITLLTWQSETKRVCLYLEITDLWSSQSCVYEPVFTLKPSGREDDFLFSQWALHFLVPKVKYT